MRLERCNLSLCSSVSAKHTEISACVWSHDGRQIATGDINSTICLWDATNKASIQYKETVKRSQTGRINQLIFAPDNTALIILIGSALLIWDFGLENYIFGLGLKESAQSIALDYPRKRVAVSSWKNVFVYDMEASGQESRQGGTGTPKASGSESRQGGAGGSSGGRESSRRSDGDKPSVPVPSDLKDISDITSKVTTSQPVPFKGLYYDIYRGVFDADRYEHVVAIKCLRTKFDPLSSVQDRQAFESVGMHNIILVY
ncbi:hypothetical protein BDP27DRAFT_1059187 [Rhodocollybia butyracea]|uniref:Uncharacterized protein n=1 Tax=Rhodocollybia butyracea TaxID=206335 RepID=A0A9P5P0E5_9AGAR|nr:hypothetical protein BDP27DRAFT_1059187 [Rhodocollybia butyracea]